MGSRREEEEWARPMMRWGEGWPGDIALSIVLFFGPIIFIVIWLFFFAAGFNVYQNFAIVIVVLLAFLGGGAALRATMGMRWVRGWEALRGA